MEPGNPTPPKRTLSRGRVSPVFDESSIRDRVCDERNEPATGLRRPTHATKATPWRPQTGTDHRGLAPDSASPCSVSFHAVMISSSFLPPIHYNAPRTRRPDVPFAAREPPFTVGVSDSFFFPPSTVPMDFRVVLNSWRRRCDNVGLQSLVSRRSQLVDDPRCFMGGLSTGNQVSLIGSRSILTGNKGSRFPRVNRGSCSPGSTLERVGNDKGVFRRRLWCPPGAYWVTLGIMERLRTPLIENPYKGPCDYEPRGHVCVNDVYSRCTIFSFLFLSRGTRTYLPAGSFTINAKVTFSSRSCGSRCVTIVPAMG